jgi:hypothetical protein
VFFKSKDEDKQTKCRAKGSFVEYLTHFERLLSLSKGPAFALRACWVFRDQKINLSAGGVVGAGRRPADRLLKR